MYTKLFSQIILFKSFHIVNIVWVYDLCESDKPLSQLHIATVRKYSNVHCMLGF